MKCLYIDAVNSGMSGDIFLAALLDLVPNSGEILKELKELKDELSGVSKLNIDLIKVIRSGIQANQLKIEIKESKNSRTATALQNALNSFLEKKSYSDPAKSYARKALNLLIYAEAEVHGKLAEKIHLHELSSVDTLIDILGVSKVLDELGAFHKNFKILCSYLPAGGGTIQSAHGLLPVPAPATLKILEKSNLTLYDGPIDSELVTPTGAALLVSLNIDAFPYDLNLEKVAYSVGQKEFKDFLNICRIFYGELKPMALVNEDHSLNAYIEPVVEIETNVDDVSGEVLGNFIEIMELEDILDIQVIPSISKKNRPGHIIKILCRPENPFDIISKVIDELGTLGVRYKVINRVCVDRLIEKYNVEIDNKSYDLNFKISFIETEKGKKIVNIKPEYEEIKEISKKSGLSLKKVLFHAQSRLKEIYNKFNPN
jgi:uncharacterized protein (TIGR00299 family) protein